MKSQLYTAKINTLKEALKNYQADIPLIGIALFRSDGQGHSSSDNWIFNTDVDLSEVIPIVITKLNNEIQQLELELIIILEEELKEQELTQNIRIDGTF